MDLDTETKRHLAELCQRGIDAVRADRYDALRFDLFHVDEAKFVRSFMEGKAPDIRYFRTWIAGGPDPRPE